MLIGFFIYLARNNSHFIRVFGMKMSKNSFVLSSLSTKRKTDELQNDQEDIPQKMQKTEDMGEITKNILLLDDKSTEKRTKLKKVAMLLCYSGKNHFGMQRNPGVKTIEEDLMLAMLKADVIIRDHYDCPKNMRFQRAARTDKGVSAVRQIVSLKMPLCDNSDHFPVKINEFLPPEIRVLGLKRVTKGFDAKTSCDARTYSYMLPTFAFSNHEEEDTEDFKITAHLVQEINKFMMLFEGTHNYHNFTAGRKAEEASSKRYIMSCKCGEPFVQDGLEFVVIKMKGQSFMLHQIRKMVGLTIAVIRKLASVDVLQKAWCNERVDIPIAPSLGLMLEEVHYEKYNQKYGGDGLHEALTWEEHQNVIHKFKQEHLLRNIALTEKNEKSMLQWLETLGYHTYDVRHSGAPGNHPSDNLKSVDLCIKNI